MVTNRHSLLQCCANVKSKPQLPYHCWISTDVFLSLCSTAVLNQRDSKPCSLHCESCIICYQSEGFDLVDSESTCRQVISCNYNILLSLKSGTFSSLNMTLSMQLHTWIYVLGYLLAFGTILAKMWRVYQIFHNPTPNKMVCITVCVFCMV